MTVGTGMCIRLVHQPTVCVQRIREAKNTAPYVPLLLTDCEGLVAAAGEKMPPELGTPCDICWWIGGPSPVGSLTGGLRGQLSTASRGGPAMVWSRRPVLCNTLEEYRKVQSLPFSIVFKQ